MMNWIEIGPVPLTLIISLVLALVLLATRLIVLQRLQAQRQRENRQESERLKSLVAAYRALAGSFTPMTAGDRPQIDGALADIVLFGTAQQVALAASYVPLLQQGTAVDYQPLVELLRADLRLQLGLEPLPAHIAIPRSGPGPAARGNAADAKDAGRPQAGGGGGAAGGAAMGAGAGVGAARTDGGHPDADSHPV